MSEIQSNMYIGKVIVAKPAVVDEVFAKKAIFIFTHSLYEGASGFIINSKKIGKMMIANNDPNFMKFLEKVKSIEDFAGKTKQIDIHSGGPCNSVNGMTEGIYLINEVELGDEILKGVYLSIGYKTDFAKLLETKKRNKAYTGISQWGPGQLEKEIEDGAWDVIEDINPEWIFSPELINHLFQPKVFFPKESYGYTPSLN